MAIRSARRRFLGAAATALALCLALGWVLVLAGCAGQAATHGAVADPELGRGSTPRDQPANAVGESVIEPSEWRAFRALVEEQKYQAAVEAVHELRRRAQEARSAEEWTRALVEEVQLTAALGGVETAVRLLRETPWPDDATSRTVLRLLYAHSLARYLDTYGWEIGQRERVASVAEGELDQWTRGQIVAEVDRAYSELWEERQGWGERSAGTLKDHLVPGDYPDRIRGTLRDAVAYLWVEFLANTGYWAPEENNTTYRLDLPALIAGRPATEDATHPLARLAELLGELEAWHRDGDRPEAAFEATLERLRRLGGHLTRADDRALLRAHLEDSLDALGPARPWWSVGQAELARLAQAEDRPGSLVEARDLARRGGEAHPGSVGGKRCAHIVASLEAPALGLEAMRVDGPGRRSIEVEHKNLERVHLRAYAVDLAAALTEGEDGNLLPAHREVERLLDRAEPSAAWTVDLPATPDLRRHRTFVTPPLDQPGLYVVVASAREDFATRKNRLQALNFIVSDLVVLAQVDERTVRVDVRSGSGGQALSGVEVELWQLDYRGGHRRVSAATTAERGRVEFTAAVGRRLQVVALARLAGDANFESVHVHQPYERAQPDSTEALVFTDRSVYRPRQEVLWKVVAYARTEAGQRLRAAPERAVTVDLVDANGETAASAEVTTNDFGSASGRFTIPAGRLLGPWHVETSLGGYTEVQVEEYKRPTFEVRLVEPDAPLRLNQPATLRGEAGYYFGLPVVEGTVEWRVSRRPRYPDWWGWFRPVPSVGEELVAGGSAPLGADGSFTLTFDPAADEREAESGVTYNYAVAVDVTDAGGETRSAERSYRLGFVAVETTLRSDRGFFEPGERPAFELTRRDLDGAPRAGAGRWRLVALEAPAEVLLPAEVPAVVAEDALATPGDRLRPRWSRDYQVAARLRAWPGGETLAEGTVEHDADGNAELALPEVPGGAYRLEYATDDPFGATFETQREFLVAGAPLPLPALLAVERSTVGTRETARLLVHSGLPDQEFVLEVARPGRPTVERRMLSTGRPRVVELAIEPADRTAIELRLKVLRDHQLITLTDRVLVPPAPRDLELRFATFRDLLRPGARERWRVEVSGPDQRALGENAAEVLAYMYDRSLDLFAPHRPPRPQTAGGPTARLEPWRVALGPSRPVWQREKAWYAVPRYPYLSPARLRFYDDYGIGGPGRMMRMRSMQPMMLESAAPPVPESTAETVTVTSESPLLDEDAAGGDLESRDGGGADETAPPEALRSDFSETAFWEPHLVTDADGAVAFEFTVPDSVTEWNVWVHALTEDLQYGALEERAQTRKELLVRPYLPRFLREGDRASIRVVVQNAGDAALSGTLDFDLRDPETDTSVAADFGLASAGGPGRPFTVEAGGSTTLTYDLSTPQRVGEVALRVVGRAGDYSDGELRPLPLLPGRFHLAQSRFAALQGTSRRELIFSELAADEDPSRIDDQLVVTLDGQLFYSVLNALPYLVDYPYECTEQTLNRFLSTGIVGSVFDDYPAVARMAAKLAARETPRASWAGDDPNRLMRLIETPWLQEATGGEPDERLIRLLDPRVARAQRDASLAKLAEAQTSLGGFPWWPGGPPSPYMTIYVVNGLSRAREFGVDVPRDMVVRAFQYLHRYYLDELVERMKEGKVHHEVVTYMNFVLSNFPDAGWTGGVFDEGDRRRMLDHSFRFWKEHSPLLKSYLALTLERAGRSADARLVFDSVMDSAKTAEDLGTYWAPEDRAWLWYNDTIETHAFALRTLTELGPDDPRRQGLVHWLMLNKKLNHWKSTRATAEVIYSLVHYLAAEGELGVREAATVTVGDIRREFVFEPEEYTGANNQIVVPGPEVDPATDATIVVEKETPGLLFASATWHYSTETLPQEAQGDFFAVQRRYFKRLRQGNEWVLEPLAEGARLEVGDQVEVHLSLRTKHRAEYVHLRDPRPAGFEPESLTSSYQWGLGIGWYEQIKDSGTDFFFESLPVGEYPFKYRLRAATAGTFKAAPATVQSMYAPEFSAFSSGQQISIGATSTSGTE